MTDKPVSGPTLWVLEDMIKRRDQRIMALERLLATVAKDALALLDRRLDHGPVIYDSTILNGEVSELLFSTRTARALEGAGIIRVGDLTKTTRAYLLGLPNMGAKSVNEIEEALGHMDLSLAGGRSPHIEAYLQRHREARP
jgi:DNA-directed RNA polymerase alpha subunit